MNDPFNLQRFVDAQEGIFPQACAELRRGRKQTHWMWFIFPQVRGLGTSPMSQQFSISSLEEARAYVAHPILGPRLAESTQIVASSQGASALQIFGQPDDLKLRSSMTLFSRAATENSLFLNVLDKYFNGHPDPFTLERLNCPTPGHLTRS